MTPASDKAAHAVVQRRRRPYTATSGALLALVPAPFALAAWSVGLRSDVSWIEPVRLGVAFLAGLAIFGGGWQLPRRGHQGRWYSTVGIVLAPTLAWPRLGDHPAFALLLAVAAIYGLGVVWHVAGGLLAPALRRGATLSGRARGAAVGYLVLWLLMAAAPGQVVPGVVWAGGASLLITATLGVSWILRAFRGGGAPPRLIAAALVVSGGLAVVARSEPWSAIGCGVVYAVIALIYGPRAGAEEVEGAAWWGRVLEHPQRLLVATFGVLVLLGSIVLALPQSATDGQGVGALDAAFTATSAVCVTGLTVRTTATEFSGFGQAVILLLMQLGGLGIMAFSVAALRLLGRRLSFRQEAAAASVLGARDRSALFASAQDVLRVTFLVEGLGIVLLSLLFLLDGDGLGEAAWRGVFTAVSAFCNAGFDIQGDSLLGYQGSPLVLHTVGSLIILGGLSPAAILALPRLRARYSRPVEVQAKLCLCMAAFLLGLGFVFILATEWDHALAHLSVWDKFHNAWFQSLTLRTAGFQSVDVAGAAPATFVLMLAFMFIGGSPGGTAGGVKTTTVAVLGLSVLRTLRGVAEVTAFNRRISEPTVARAAVVISVAVLGMFGAVLALALTQDIPLQDLVFEAVSALGTVGLSVGATGKLDALGKAIIIVCMFVGRIGGLTIMMSLGDGNHAASRRPPVASVDVG